MSPCPATTPPPGESFRTAETYAAWSLRRRNVRMNLHSLLATLDSRTRDDFRRALIRDHADRDAIASTLMRYRDENGQGWADIIDFLTMYPDARRRVVRLLGEIGAR